MNEQDEETLLDIEELMGRFKGIGEWAKDGGNVGYALTIEICRFLGTFKRYVEHQGEEK